MSYFQDFCSVCWIVSHIVADAITLIDDGSIRASYIIFYLVVHAKPVSKSLPYYLKNGLKTRISKLFMLISPKWFPLF